MLDSPEIPSFQGAERLWRFTPRRIVRRPDALPLRWAPEPEPEPEGASINSLMTGDWEEAAQRQKATALAQTWLIHGARTLTERAFDTELSELITQSGGTVRQVRALTNIADALAGEDYDVAGRIDLALLRATLPFDDYDFYPCGPAAFMQGLYDGLRGLNIADGRIHAGGFGPASLRRTADEHALVKAFAPVATTSVPVMFLESGKEARWEPYSGSLLELAKERGLAPEYGCRSGSCGSCRTKILKGAVTYMDAPSFAVADDEALICCAVPAASEDGDVRLQLAL